MNLTKSDYKNILMYYNINFSDNLSLTTLKKMVEKIIAEKLCRCIKKVPNENNPESRAIGICNYSVIKRKNLKINSFTCKNKPKLTLKNKSKRKQNITKTRNNLNLNIKKKKNINN